jgi:hypothetical protein
MRVNYILSGWIRRAPAAPEIRQARSQEIMRTIFVLKGIRLLGGRGRVRICDPLHAIGTLADALP